MSVPDTSSALAVGPWCDMPHAHDGNLLEYLGSSWLYNILHHDLLSHAQLVVTFKVHHSCVYLSETPAEVALPLACSRAITTEL